MGSPQNPSADQMRQLERAGQLELLDSPRWIDAPSGVTELNFDLPREALSLVELSW